MKPLRPLLIRILRCRKGVSAVEFALVTPVLLAGIMSLVDLGVAVFHKMEVTSAVRSGAQYALVDKDDIAGIEAAVNNSTNLPAASMTVSATESCDCISTAGVISALGSCGDSCSGTDTKRYLMTVNASHVYNPVFLPTDLTLTGSVTLQTQ